MGLNTFVVPYAMHLENRSRLVEKLRAGGTLGGTVLLKGGESEERYDTDHEVNFRQESYFQYLFGVMEPDFWGCIEFDEDSMKCVLFCPRLPTSYNVWMGRIKPAEEFRDHYEVDEARYVDELAEYLSPRLDGGARAPLLLLNGQNSDSGNSYLPPNLPEPLGAAVKQSQTVVDTATLFPILANNRVYKSAKEMDLMRHVSKVSSLAHVCTMRTIKPGMMEYQAEATFSHYAYFHYGCRNVGYTSICACGPDPAVLHYGHAGAPNDQKIKNFDSKF